MDNHSTDPYERSSYPNGQNSFEDINSRNRAVNRVTDHREHDYDHHHYRRDYREPPYHEHHSRDYKRRERRYDNNFSGKDPRDHHNDFDPFINSHHQESVGYDRGISALDMQEGGLYDEQRDLYNRQQDLLEQSHDKKSRKVKEVYNAIDDITPEQKEEIIQKVKAAFEAQQTFSIPPNINYDIQETWD